MDDLGSLIGASPAIEAVRSTVRRLTRGGQGGRRPPSILLQGDTGTGKGLLAALLHRTGPRSRGPFVDVNCAAIPDTLLESELFGFERGAFTDARQAKPGLFQTANRGTIFLDEIALLGAPLQAKLLKVLEEGAVRRLGSTRSEVFDVWVISATNASLDTEIREGRFREDLYHRLAVLTLSMPALRDRGNDVLLLAEHFLTRTCAEYGLPRLVLTDDARAKLTTYAWPGNIRELANVIERASLLAEGTVLTGGMLQLADAPAPRAPRATGAATDVSVKRSVASLEERLILDTLTETTWNISRTAAQLGIARNTLRARIRKYGLRPGGAPASPPPSEPVTEAARQAPPPPPAPSPRAGVLWESRRLALLRVVVAARDQGQSAVESARTVEMLIEKVEAFGGRVVELAVRGITAAFGLDPVEDAPRRAALAALAMQKAAVRDAHGSGDGRLMHAAIHVVQVPTARVGGVTDIDGDTKRGVWSLLDTLIAGAEPGAIVVSQSALPLLERRFAVAETEASDPAAGRLYRLTDFRATSFELGGQMGRFVGRAHELGFLSDRFETARQGQGQVVALVGEAGIGKSRLLFEFRQSVADEQVTYLQGHCFSYASAVPYLPILEVTRALAGVLDSDTPEETGEKVRRFLVSVEMDAAERAPYVLHLLGVKDGTEAVSALSPAVVWSRTMETLHTMFIKTSEHEPLVLAVEDLHWIDPASEEYLTSLVERLSRTRMLVIVTYRPGYQPRWAQKSMASQMALQPLATEDCLSVVRVVFGADYVPESLARSILDKAEGNPFFLEELARSAREQEPHAASALAAPDTIQEVLLARIDRLPREERRLLQAAAVIGKDFTLDVLEAIADLAEETLRRALQNLRAAEFIGETTLFPEAEYTFKHALTHDVAYQTLAPDERRRLHAMTFAAIERLHSERLGERAERLAHHAFHGELWEQAFTCSRDAGRKAMSRSANRAAVEYFEQALNALANLPSTREYVEHAIDLRFEVRHALTPLGRVHRTLEHLRAAEALAVGLDDQHRIARAMSFMANCLVLEGRYREALVTGAKALTVARDLDHHGLQIAAQIYIARARVGRGECGVAAELFREIVHFLDVRPFDDAIGLPVLPAAFARSNLAAALADLGAFGEAEAHANEAARRAEGTEKPDSLVWAQWGVARVALVRGHAHEAIQVFRRLLALCRTYDLEAYVSRILAGLGCAQSRVGEFEEGLPLLEQAVGLDSSAEPRTTQTLAVTALAEANFLAGKLDKAAMIATEALLAAATNEERGVEAYASWVLGMARSASDEPTLGEDYLNTAVAITAELGQQPLLAHCYLGLAALYRRTDRTAEAEDYRRRGEGLLEILDMRPWIPLSYFA
jgi:DNA-binding NtrC family response regulator/tetratricopeptide (TPR) repeat protein